jgi:hypothetical protein
MPPTLIPAGKLGLRSDKSTVEMLTVQAASILDILHRDTVARPDLGQSDYFEYPEYARAYRWMSRQVAARAEVPAWFDPEAGAMFWLWAHTTRKALVDQARSAALSDAAQVVLRVRIPKSRVVLSDFDDWHCVLNVFPVYDADERSAFEAAVAGGLDYASAFEETLEVSFGSRWRFDELDASTVAALEQTWQHCLVERPRRWNATQGCVAHLELSDIIDIIEL